ncbi:MAG: bifunctional tRNA (5-methylaminomethyl-2-thiouridine)(34)-methyltransferase MnmD/FAD-dependent 5-carboxymethylaminomethyl-2-thiouridine(34) oxidoreductase MnmC [Rhodospirillaceae bacterium]|nr:bifunctional tRNA (5-methylaminomethyl-2-thiouridine)(34)-methyltransferase MnmD/FAD-dependent 5-carboxymethylaminomethyl-2-thiouridine(34) oxidoreductase MnmC [Rhodospirillaceae bacterium]
MGADMAMADERNRHLASPGLAWEPGRTPCATRFDEVYYSRENGLAEARHVFLQGCGLPESWRDAEVFVIGELGFGTGLNFLATWELWQRTRRPGARLHYLAVEGFPLSQTELGECLDPWPELFEFARGLRRVYPAPQRGFHRLFPGDDVYLTLLLGEAVDMLGQLECSVDAWFLDGFSPDKNPDMWRKDVFAQIVRLSHKGSTPTLLATYSAAGDVRRGLDEAGFDIAHAPGLGQKRDMLRGRFRGGTGTVPPKVQPWFARPPAAPARGGRAAIIGGGIAGTNIAYALRRRGWRTTIVDRRSELADEASGNPVGVLMPRLTAAPSLDGRFYAGAWRFAMATLEALADKGAQIQRQRCGLLQLAADSADEQRLAAIAASASLPDSAMRHLSAKDASDIAGVTHAHAALYFPQAGWLAPRALCAALAEGSTTVMNFDVASLRHANGLWEVIDHGGRVRLGADVVVLANALGALSLPQAAWLPLAARRGQISYVPATAASAALRCVLVYGGYVTPAHRGLHTLGATFEVVETDAGNDSTDVRVEDHAQNLAALKAHVPGFFENLAPDALAGRAGVRCTSPDHLPVVGALPDRDAYLRDFAALRHGQSWVRYPDATYQAGLYALLGLGSRGLVAAPLAAELLACHITGEPWPIERDLVTALHAGRFLVRVLKRQEA